MHNKKHKTRFQKSHFMVFIFIAVSLTQINVTINKKIKHLYPSIGQYMTLYFIMSGREMCWFVL